jgi:hypothetical protein
VSGRFLDIGHNRILLLRTYSFHPELVLKEADVKATHGILFQVQCLRSVFVTTALLQAVTNRTESCELDLKHFRFLVIKK